MTSYLHDGVVFDLDRVYVDVIGVEWRWSGGYSATGEPLMAGGTDRTPVPLPDVYHDHGPLIPMPLRPTKAMCKAVVAADFADSVAAGHIETYEQYARRTAQAAP